VFDALCHPGHAITPSRFLRRAAEAGVEGLMLGGYDPGDWRHSDSLHTDALTVLRSSGLHPWAVTRDNSEAIAILGERLSAGMANAVGEIGLDRARARATYAHQQVAFAAQLALARDHGLPVVLHVVKAHGRALSLLDEHPPPGGVVHGFTSAPEIAREYMKRGLHISFGGALLKPLTKRARASAASVPLERLVIETDAPDQLPNPADLHRVLAALSGLRPESTEALAEATAANARRAYRV